MIIYNRTLSPAERLSVGAYFNRRYAIVASAPDAPTDVVAAAISPTQASLKWSSSASASTTYRIERKTGAGGSFAQVGEVQDGLSFVDTSLSAGTEYFYRIQAVNFAGSSPYSSEAGVTTPNSGTEFPLSNVRVWLKADAGVVAQGGSGTAGVWLDQSGNGNHASQSIAANQPPT